MASESEEMVLMRTVPNIFIGFTLMALVALNLGALAQAESGTDGPVNVGGNFGRTWLESNLPTKSDESASDNLSNLSNLSEADPLSEDWLGITTSLKARNETNDESQSKAKLETPYSYNRIITPVHQMDASWNQSEAIGLPEPDRNGLINGIPAEMYYSIGPAYFDF